MPVSHETTWYYLNLFKLSTSPFVINNINNLFYLRHTRAVNDPYGLSVMENIYPRFNLTPQERNTPWHELEHIVLNKYLYALSPQQRKELIEIKPRYSGRIQELDMMTRRIAHIPEARVAAGSIPDSNDCRQSDCRKNKDKKKLIPQMVLTKLSKERAENW